MPKREGGASDFHLLLEEQIPRLMRYASALTRDPDEAGELVEDTVRDALANRHRCRGGAEIRVWLFTILHDLRGNPFRTAICAPDALDRDPASLLTLSDLDRALGQLPEEQRAVILLIGLEGMTYEQTATVLQISRGAMRSRLTRGRDNLRRAMGVGGETQLSRAAGPAAADGGGSSRAGSGAGRGGASGWFPHALPAQAAGSERRGSM